MDLLPNIALGLSNALSTTNLLYCFIGVSLGTLLGVIPGIGVLAAMSMLFPVTFYLPPDAALIMLAGIWYGTTYGGSTASILLNVPGTPANAVTCLDGYPMARNGRAGTALFMTTVASFFGASVGIVLLMLFSPVIAQFALRFADAEFFALMLLGLVAASTMSSGSVLKGLAMMIVGIMLGIVGADIGTGVHRFTFGQLDLVDGISIVALAMGIFGVSEVIASVGKITPGSIPPESVRLKAMAPTKDELRRSWFPMVRGSAIGSFFGALPGAGPGIAAFIAYATEKRVSKTPERFGKGAIEGIMAPEAANNAADQTAFIPTLTLGIPGSVTMALILGVLMIHGIQPGPNLITNQPALFWGLIMSFWIGNIMLLFLNIPFVGLWVRLLTIPYHLLFPAVLVFICIGTYTLSYNRFDIWLVAAFGLAGYVMRLAWLPAAPLLLGFVLGPLMEDHFRRAIQLARGDITTFFTRPVSGVIMAIVLALLIWSFWSALRRPIRSYRSTRAGRPPS
ncbi:tripartite tricarboxylate transporter permease [Pararhodobacter sp.]|uniref:tripartite tricarboxylate transporter permease n=1 Tax=Pararhodobacter sp. TaxID=2127056 RepID=UPI002FDD3C94